MAGMARLAGGAAMLAAVVVVSPPAGWGDPGQFPDLNSYVQVDPAPFETYTTYGSDGRGVQFSTPGGYRCRMIKNVRGGWMSVSCWGSLPGTSQNLVTGGDMSPARFSTVDLAAQETYQRYEGTEPHTYTVNPDDYKPLPSGSKVTKQGTGAQSGTCGVDAAMTACEIEGGPTGERHGFVLSPQGSSTF
ncbi:hypothetical protein [Mycobacterium talmoniae]|nr:MULTISPECIES: hypothetical protein [Mycobacterium]TDH52057.1 hypothetical protein E2F47_14795 [Mycobacterium eburneum]